MINNYKWWLGGLNQTWKPGRQPWWSISSTSSTLAVAPRPCLRFQARGSICATADLPSRLVSLSLLWRVENFPSNSEAIHAQGIPRGAVLAVLTTHHGHNNSSRFVSKLIISMVTPRWSTCNSRHSYTTPRLTIVFVCCPICALKTNLAMSLHVILRAGLPAEHPPSCFVVLHDKYGYFSQYYKHLVSIYIYRERERVCKIIYIYINTLNEKYDTKWAV